MSRAAGVREPVTCAMRETKAESLVTLFGSAVPVPLPARARRRQQHPQRLLQQIRVPPEDVEGLLEERPLLDAADETRLQHIVQLEARGHAGDLQRLQREQRPIGAHREAGAAQQAREVQYVFRQPAAGGRRQRRLR